MTTQESGTLEKPDDFSVIGGGTGVEWRGCQNKTQNILFFLKKHSTKHKKKRKNWTDYETKTNFIVWWNGNDDIVACFLLLPK